VRSWSEFEYINSSPSPRSTRLRVIRFGFWRLNLGICFGFRYSDLSAARSLPSYFQSRIRRESTPQRTQRTQRNTEKKKEDLDFRLAEGQKPPFSVLSVNSVVQKNKPFSACPAPLREKRSVFFNFEICSGFRYSDLSIARSLPSDFQRLIRRESTPQRTQRTQRNTEKKKEDLDFPLAEGQKPPFSVLSVNSVVQKIQSHSPRSPRLRVRSGICFGFRILENISPRVPGFPLTFEIKKITMQSPKNSGGCIMQLTIRTSDEITLKIEQIAKSMGLKKSDVTRMALKKFTDDYLNETKEDRPYQKVKHLIGIVESGKKDLGQAHREYMINKIKNISK